MLEQESGCVGAVSAVPAFAFADHDSELCVALRWIDVVAHAVAYVIAVFVIDCEVE